MSGRFLVHDGCSLSYETVGDGPPVVFIQGIGVHGRGWTPQVDSLSDGFRCLLFDNRGMGGSQPLEGPLSVGRMAGDALALLEELGWDSAHVVGHSLGGLIALEMAISAPERVRSLSLLCTVARGRDATRLSPRILWLGLRCSLGTRSMRRRAFLELILPPSRLPRLERDRIAASMEPLFGHDLADRPPVVMKQMQALRGYDATPSLGKTVGLPTLVVSARHDPIAPPRFGRQLAAHLPGARYVELPNASHGVTIQDPEAINVLLREHLNRAEELHRRAIGR